MSLDSAASPSDGSSNQSNDRQEPHGQPLSLKTTLAHQGLTLVPAAFIVFEVGFVALLCSKDWFTINLNLLGIPAILFALGIAHFLLTWAESPSGTAAFAWLKKGTPLVFYRHWLTMDAADLKPGMSLGLRHLVWEAIDELELTWLGNLIVKTRILCGASLPPPPGNLKLSLLDRFGDWFKHRRSPEDADVVFKIPFGIASPESQKLLVDRVRLANPDVIINQRLIRRLEAPQVKGTQFVQALGAVFLTVVLLDVGYATFNYLEILKALYLSKQAALENTAESKSRAKDYFRQSEKLYEHPLPLSWVSNKLLRGGAIAADLLEDQSQALWLMGEPDQAIEKLRQAVALEPKKFRRHLVLAKRLVQAGKLKEGRAEIDEAIANHKSAFLPRLYMLAVDSKGKDIEMRRRLLRIYESELDDEVFGEEPVWPPSGRRYIADVMYRDDLHFVFNRLLGLDAEIKNEGD